MILGIDVGSRTTKVVLWDGRSILAFRIEPTGADMKEKASQMIEAILKDCGLGSGKVDKMVATGYGRQQVDTAKRVSEISCQAKAIHFLFPKAKTVIDIGGQDSKVILLGPEGKVLDFIMNDKCAAGTGRFLEMMAGVLEIALEDYGTLFNLATEEVSLSSTCAVFAESELISLMAGGKRRESLARAVCFSVAERTVSLIERVGGQPPFVFTGGVAENRGVLQALEKKLKASLLVPPYPQITAALGACLLG